MQAIATIQRIWSQDPPYDLPGDSAPSDQGRHHPASRHRLYAETVPEARPADHHVGHQPELGDRARGGSARLEYLSGNNVPTSAVATHWQTYSKACAEAGKPARGENWRVARNVMVAESDAEAQDRIYGEHSSKRYF